MQYLCAYEHNIPAMMLQTSHTYIHEVALPSGSPVSTASVSGDDNATCVDSPACQPLDPLTRILLLAHYTQVPVNHN